ILEVTDRGVGISKKDQERVFEKFFRAEGGDVHNTKGTGLGLSLISEIMKAHRGSVELKSKLGEGSTFKLKFPIKHG
ncbi:MAG: HAMP domain-containing sensor histidine kinase, partial [Bacteroidota bacterium]